MEVRSANTALLNKAATAVDGYGSDGREKQQPQKVHNAAAEIESELEEQPVKLSISAAGMRRSQQLEKQPSEEAGEDAFTGEVELDNMLKKMEGLSSQVINGHFSISDRLNFNNEINRLTYELNSLNGNGATVTMEDCSRLSQRISDLTRIISDAAVYRNSARTVFVVNSKQPAMVPRATVDIAI